MEFKQELTLAGDILIKVKNNGYYYDSLMYRVGLNTTFVQHKYFFHIK
jgi:hypothetical protein